MQANEKRKALNLNSNSFLVCNRARRFPTGRSGRWPAQVSPAQREGARVRGRLAEMQDSAQARLAQIETELQDLGHAEARSKAAGVFV